MGSTGLNNLTRSPATKRARSRRWGWGAKSLGAQVDQEQRSDPLVPIGQQLRAAREFRALNLGQLAEETRISAAVLEALERGWRDRLPEATYLRTMLTLLEGHLNLPPGSLDGALPLEGARGGDADNQFRKFRPNSGSITPGSIDVFTTWHGTWIYAVLSLALLYGINLQQQRLAAQGLLALHPVAPLPPSEERQLAAPKAEQQLLQLYPELRPLDQAAQGQGLKQLHLNQSSRGEVVVPGSVQLRP